MSGNPDGDDAAGATGGDDAADAQSRADDKRAQERRRLIDLTRHEKGLPERRRLGWDRRAPRPNSAPGDVDSASTDAGGDVHESPAGDD